MEYLFLFLLILLSLQLVQLMSLIQCPCADAKGDEYHETKYECQAHSLSI